MHECYACTGALERQTSGVARQVAVADRNFNTPTRAVTCNYQGANLLQAECTPASVEFAARQGLGQNVGHLHGGRAVLEINLTPSGALTHKVVCDVDVLAATG